MQALGRYGSRRHPANCPLASPQETTNLHTGDRDTRDMAKRINVGLDEFNKVNGG